MAEVKQAINELDKLEQVVLPKAVYLVEKEMTERKESRLFKIICVLIVCWLLTIGGFLWYLNQYDFTDTIQDIYQDVDSVENGTSTISDGIHYTKN